MNNDIENFETLTSQIISAFGQNREVKLIPSQMAKEALEAGLKIVQSEKERKRKMAEKAGRKRKPDSELKNPEKALQMRRLRAKWGANNKPPEAEKE
jgi:hypothetical protein